MWWKICWRMRTKAIGQHIYLVKIFHSNCGIWRCSVCCLQKLLHKRAFKFNEAISYSGYYVAIHKWLLHIFHKTVGVAEAHTMNAYLCNCRFMGCVFSALGLLKRNRRNVSHISNSVTRKWKTFFCAMHKCRISEFFGTAAMYFPQKCPEKFFLFIWRYKILPVLYNWH